MRDDWKNSAHRAAFDKGRRAADAGEPRWCPYADLRTKRGSVTGSRAFRNAWLDGYDSCLRGEA